jgi:CRP-like cAMP-binding protein
VVIEKHLLKVRARDDIDREEEDEIRSLIGQVVQFPAHQTVVRSGQELHQSLLLLDGWMCRMKDLHGGQRQIAELNVAGDFVDLHGFTLKTLDHDVVTISDCRVALVPHDRLRDMTERFPHLTRVYWFLTNLDAAIHREWTLSLGRRAALARMAHLFCEMFVRLRIVGLTDEGAYDFPLTQVELGECLGLTSVHVNRTLQELRRRDLVELRGRRLKILDWEGLEGVAEFEDSYLYLDKKQR